MKFGLSFKNIFTSNKDKKVETTVKRSGGATLSMPLDNEFATEAYFKAMSKSIYAKRMSKNDRESFFIKNHVLNDEASLIYVSESIPYYAIKNMIKSAFIQKQFGFTLDINSQSQDLSGLVNVKKFVLFVCGWAKRELGIKAFSLNRWSINSDPVLKNLLSIFCQENHLEKKFEDEESDHLYGKEIGKAEKSDNFKKYEEALKSGLRPALCFKTIFQNDQKFQQSFFSHISYLMLTSLLRNNKVVNFFKLFNANAGGKMIYSDSAKGMIYLAEFLRFVYKEIDSLLPEKKTGIWNWQSMSVEAFLDLFLLTSVGKKAIDELSNESIEVFSDWFPSTFLGSLKSLKESTINFSKVFFWVEKLSAQDVGDPELNFSTALKAFYLEISNEYLKKFKPDLSDENSLGSHGLTTTEKVFLSPSILPNHLLTHLLKSRLSS